jgi:predicted nucleic acid-binding protein
VAARRLYVDSSACLAVLLSERGSADLVRETQGARLLSSVVLVLEVERNLVRLSREGRIEPATLQDLRDRFRRDLEEFTLREVTLELCLSSVMPPITTPRSLDLLHLRTAVEFHEQEPLDRFLTTDERQRVAARELGLPV